MVVASFHHGYGCQSVSLSDSQVENVPTTSRGLKSVLPKSDMHKYSEKSLRRKDVEFINVAYLVTSQGTPK